MKTLADTALLVSEPGISTARDQQQLFPAGLCAGGLCTGRGLVPAPGVADRVNMNMWGNRRDFSVTVIAELSLLGLLSTSDEPQ